jgi:superfamily II DNA or RNA helicase
VARMNWDRAQRLRRLGAISLAETEAWPVDLSVALAPEAELFAWQQRALDAWNAAERRGIVAAVTGAGKTVVGVEALRQHLQEHDRLAKAVIVVPTIELLRQWERTMRAHLPEVSIALVGGGQVGQLVDADVLVAVMNSAADRVPEQVRLVSSVRPVLLIADECHRLGAESFSRILDAPFAATLGLSATPERSGDFGMERRVFPRLGPVVYRYSHADALADGVIADFAIAFIGVATPRTFRRVGRASARRHSREDGHRLACEASGSSPPGIETIRSTHCGSVIR